MKLPPGAAIDQFVELKFKPASWEQHGIPAEGCRVRRDTLERLVENGGACKADDLIYGLMDWLDVTDDPVPALQTLRLLLDRHYPADRRLTARCRLVDEEGVDRIFHIGAIDCGDPLVSWQRRSWVIAVAQPSAEASRMIVGAPGPITLSVAERILSLSMTRFMGEPFDSFEGARTVSRSTGSYYSWDQGAATTMSWEHGLAVTEREGKLCPSPEDAEMPASDGWLPPNQLAMMVAIAAGYLG